MPVRLELEEIKERELRLLIRFAEYCDQHDLCYVLGGGTLLGAVRHQGFIPWDDDIDVMMPRPDYLRFMELQNVNPELDFVSITNNTMSYPFMKILDKEIKVDMTYVDATGTAGGGEDCLWMDVFPIDGLPESKRETAKVFRKSLFLRKLLFIANARLGKGTTLFRKVVKIPLHLALNIIGRFRLAHMIDYFCQKKAFNESKYVGGIAWGYGPQERMPRKEWLQRTKVTFESHEFWAPGCWDFYLKRLYGNYMELPSAEKRVPHNMSAWKEN